MVVVVSAVVVGVVSVVSVVSVVVVVVGGGGGGGGSVVTGNGWLVHGSFDVLVPYVGGGGRFARVWVVPARMTGSWCVVGRTGKPVGAGELSVRGTDCDGF